MSNSTKSENFTKTMETEIEIFLHTFDPVRWPRVRIRITFLFSLWVRFCCSSSFSHYMKHKKWPIVSANFMFNLLYFHLFLNTKHLTQSVFFSNFHFIFCLFSSLWFSFSIWSSGSSLFFFSIFFHAQTGLRLVLGLPFVIFVHRAKMSDKKWMQQSEWMNHKIKQYVEGKMGQRWAFLGFSFHFHFHFCFRFRFHYFAFFALCSFVYISFFRFLSIFFFSWNWELRMKLFFGGVCWTIHSK